jgi:hypothetical protein
VTTSELIIVIVSDGVKESPAGITAKAELVPVRSESPQDRMFKIVVTCWVEPVNK